MFFYRCSTIRAKFGIFSETPGYITIGTLYGPRLTTIGTVVSYSTDGDSTAGALVPFSHIRTSYNKSTGALTLKYISQQRRLCGLCYGCPHRIRFFPNSSIPHRARVKFLAVHQYGPHNLGKFMRSGNDRFPRALRFFQRAISMHKPIAAGLVPIPNHPEHQLHKGRPELLRSTLGDLPVMHCLIRALHPWHQPRIRRILRIAHKPPNIVRSSWTSLSSLTFLAICCSAS